MNIYYIFGMKIETDLTFVQLMDTPGYQLTDEEIAAMPLVKIMAKKLPDEIMKINLEKEQPWYFGKDYSWLVNNIVGIEVRNGNSIYYEIIDGCDHPQYTQTYILGWGMSMLALQQGRLAMHCSVVSNDDGAILISGESGAGKSTVTTAFLKQGYRLMADDMTYVEYVPNTTDEDGSQVPAYEVAYPAFPYQKLCRDAAEKSKADMSEMIYIDEFKDKFLVPCHDIFSAKPCKIRGQIILYKMDGDSEIKCEKLSAFDGFYGCVNNLFLRRLLGEEKYSPEVGALGMKFASVVPVFTLGRPDGKDTSEEISKLALRIADEI